MPLKGTRDTNTMAESLRGVLQDLAYIATLPDADVEFVSAISQQILGKLREPIDAYMNQAQNSMGGQPGMEQGMPPGGVSPSPGPMPAGTAGLRNGGTAPPPDELRRILGMGAGA